MSVLLHISAICQPIELEFPIAIPELLAIEADVAFWLHPLHLRAAETMLHLQQIFRGALNILSDLGARSQICREAPLGRRLTCAIAVLCLFYPVRSAMENNLPSTKDDSRHSTVDW